MDDSKKLVDFSSILENKQSRRKTRITIGEVGMSPKFRQVLENNQKIREMIESKKEKK